VIVDNLNLFRTCLGPPKTETPLIVYPNAELARTAAFQGFQSIAWRHPEIVKSRGNLQLPELSPRHHRNVGEPADPDSLRKVLCISSSERPDHNP
jgi:hypothetical protein